MRKSISLVILILIFVASMVWAEKAVDKKAKEWEGEAAEWFMKGHKALSAENYDEAIKCYKKTIELDPSFTNAYFFLGNVYLKKRMLDNAIREYKKAIVLRPHAAPTHAKLGSAYLKKGMLDEAMSESKETIAIEPTNALAHFNLGCVYYKQGLISSAADHLYRAGSLYFKQGNKEGALEAYENLKRTNSKKLKQLLFDKLYPELKKKKREPSK